MVDLNLLKLEACTLEITHTVTVRIEQVLFVNNTSTDRALTVEADTVCIEKSDFFSNDGGAVNIKANQTVINGSRFNSNTASCERGGALHVFSKNVYIEKSDFFSNNGGAVNIQSHIKAVINNSKFNSN